MRNRIYFIVFIVFLTGCGLNRNKPEMTEALTGNWLVLYPDHDTRTKAQNNFYAHAQDSIVRLFGLKLLSFKSGGVFQQMDSLYSARGKWQLKANEVIVTNGGRGWENFHGRLIGFIKDSLRIVEYIHFDRDSVRVVWVLKKINDNEKASSLFDEERNRWRDKPSRRQTIEELKEKLRDMLGYYGDYYQLVSQESVYFTGARVRLPFKYYQHGAGLQPFEDADGFSALFYDNEDARKAYDLLEDVFEKVNKRKFPSGENYVEEYAVFMERMAKAI